MCKSTGHSWPSTLEYCVLTRIVSRIILEPLEDFLLILIIHPPSIGRLPQSFLIIEVVLTQTGCCSQILGHK